MQILHQFDRKDVYRRLLSFMLSPEFSVFSGKRIAAICHEFTLKNFMSKERFTLPFEKAAAHLQCSEQAFKELLHTEQNLTCHLR